MTAATLESRTRWGVVMLGFLAGTVGMFQTAKMSVVLVDVQRDIGLDLVEASWTTTATSLLGAILGVQAGRICGEFGLVRMLIASLIVSTLAAVVTALVSDPAIFFASRIVEGLGYLFICAASPALMAAVAAPRDKGVALSIWGAFVPVSVSLMSIAGPPIDAAYGWRVLFLASAAAVGVTAVLVILAVRDPEPFPRAAAGRIAAMAREAPGLHLRLYRSRPLMGLAIAFLSFAALQVGVIALLPTYLITGAGLTAGEAGTVLSAITPFAIAGTVVAAVLQKLRAPDLPSAFVAFAAMGLTSAGLFLVGGDMAALIGIGMALFTAGGVVASVIFASLSKRSDNASEMALYSGLIVQFGNMGALTGAPILASVAERWSWAAAPTAVVSMAALGMVGVILAREQPAVRRGRTRG
ncbi:CynX/NimT family MFS transporter [Chthonobacter albigriseus]|uniref:MFS transporter n=1 Tax=Chthonobacter albigriseus TaxID=1683161 RepID=UPI0015EFA0E4|nr:MFS transporter [Chthonobacter albigriseus]